MGLPAVLGGLFMKQLLPGLLSGAGFGFSYGASVNMGYNAVESMTPQNSASGGYSSYPSSSFPFGSFTNSNPFSSSTNPYSSIFSGQTQQSYSSNYGSSTGATRYYSRKYKMYFPSYASFKTYYYQDTGVQLP